MSLIRTLHSLQAPLISAFLFLLVWEDLDRILNVPNYVLPAPSDVLWALFSPNETGQLTLVYLLNATLQTATAAFLGFIIAAVLGVLIGTILASIGLLRKGVYPLANLLQMVPIIALAPLLNIWFGYGIAGVSAAACIVAIFPVIANTVDGLRSVDPRLLELFEIYGATPRQRWIQLELPAALPQIFTGFRISAGLAVIGAVVGELVSGILDSPPIGTVIASNLRSGQLELVFSAILCSALVGFSLFGLVSWTSNRVLGSWHASAQRGHLDQGDSDLGLSHFELKGLQVFLVAVFALTTWAFGVDHTPPSPPISSLSSELSSPTVNKDASPDTLTDQDQKEEAKTQPVQVRIQLNWVPEPEFGGIYEAHFRGYDVEEGLEFKIIAGGAGVPSPQLIAAQKVEFGIVGADQVITMRKQGAQLVSLFASFNRSPRAIMTHPENAPDSLETLWKSNRMIAVEAGSNFVKWLDHRYGRGDLRLVASQGGLSQFRQNPQLSQAAFVFSEPVALKLDRVPTRIFPVDESGFNPYSVIIATSQAYLNTHPQQVAKVQKILKKGWESYLENPLFTNRKIAKLNPSMSLEAMNEAARMVEPFVRGDALSLGTMTLERWRTLAQQMVTLGLVKDPDPPESFFHPFPHLPSSSLPKSN